MSDPSRLRLAIASGVALLVATSAVAAPPPAAGKAPPLTVDIPFEQFTLPNGLRVIVHTDRKAPIVAVNLWYHVGSKNEPRGRSGFAHLFEHLMFQESENHKGEYFEPFELVGATDQNGTTNSDRTNYFENVPTTALDTALWMESDRMGHLLGAINQAVLDEQRGVVQNEKRQNENQPYGRAYTLIREAMYPEDHPYHHTTIGSMADLNAAKLDDVKNWFRSWYGPNNAVLVLAGDIDVATAKDKVTRFFGDIAPTASLAKLAPRVVTTMAAKRMTVTDNVPQTRLYKVWHVPPYGSADSDYADVLSFILGRSQASRLAQRLTFKDKLADRVFIQHGDEEIAGTFGIVVDVKAGVEPATVEAALDDEVKQMIARGPTADEVEQARTAIMAGVIRGAERIGGFGGKADTLAECQVFAGNAGCYREQLARIQKVTPAQLRAFAARWLSKNAFTLQVAPGERTPADEPPTVADLPPTTVAPPAKGLKALATGVDRSTGVPIADKFPELRFPALTRATLSNGLKVVLAERRGLPVVQMSMEFLHAGSASDQGVKSGTATMALAMLDEGAGAYDALAYAARKSVLGATIRTGAAPDLARVLLSAMSSRLDDSLALFADVILRPRLDPADFERVRGRQLSAIKQEKAQPIALGRRLLPTVLFPANHPYALPSSGTEQGVAALSRDDLQRWLATWLRPDNATLIVVGDTSLAELTPKLEKAFAGWKAPAAALPAPALPAARPPAKPRVFLVDQPGAIQASLFVGQLVPSTLDPGALDFDLSNGVLGGDFSARINMNLREDKHWSYGASSGVRDQLGPRVWVAAAPVQIDKAAESAAEMRREIVDYVTGKAPAKPAELTRLQSVQTKTLPGAYETADTVLGTVSGLVLYHRPDDYPQQRASHVNALTLDALKRAAAAVQPTALTWVIVGDLKKIEQPIRALNLGELKILDPDGKIVR
ncbi:MAG TPA: pitrilysin family protein [Kofleriaceae bacterium]|nr:pitrilysin family protein [Kofleriaceae bacterium]